MIQRCSNDKIYPTSLVYMTCLPWQDPTLVFYMAKKKVPITHPDPCHDLNWTPSLKVPAWSFFFHAALWLGRDRLGQAQRMPCCSWALGFAVFCPNQNMVWPLKCQSWGHTGWNWCKRHWFLYILMLHTGYHIFVTLRPPKKSYKPGKHDSRPFYVAVSHHLQLGDVPCAMSHLNAQFTGWKRCVRWLVLDTMQKNTKTI